MAYTTIDDPTAYFQTKLYAGNGSSQSITFDGNSNMQPDWVWVKCRNDGKHHSIYDSVRGATKYLISNRTDADQTNSGGVTSFDSNGFSVGSFGDVNASFNFASWNWKAGGSASSNTDGSITSSVSANTTAGFSIATFTTSSGSSDTIGHGLGVAPSVVICKATSASDDWFVFHESLGATKRTRLNLTNATDTNTIWNDTAPTSSVFSLRLTNFGTSRSGVAYCFAEKKGYSKFGSYEGNGVASGGGPFIYLGFKPAFFLLKESSGSDNWTLMDSKRLGYNKLNHHLFPNLDNVEYASDRIELRSNGVKVIDNDGSINQDGQTYIYMAFAEAPFVSSGGIPTTAR